MMSATLDGGISVGKANGGSPADATSSVAVNAGVDLASTARTTTLTVMPGDELWTIKQCANFTGRAELTIRRWIKGRLLRAYRMGPRSIRILRSDLLNVLEPIE